MYAKRLAIRHRSRRAASEQELLASVPFDRRDVLRIVVDGAIPRGPRWRRQFVEAGRFVAVNRAIKAGSLRRELRLIEREKGLSYPEAENIRQYYRQYKNDVISSSRRFIDPKLGDSPYARMSALAHTPGADMIVVRNSELRGPMSVFGFDYLSDNLGRNRVSKLRLLNYTGLRGAGGDYAYETLNLTRKKRRAADVWKDVSAIYGPIPVEFVIEYLEALLEAGVITRAASIL